MFAKLFGSSGSSATPATIPCPDPASSVDAVRVLVIQSDAYDWHSIFDGARTSGGRPFQVVQCGWKDFHVSAQGGFGSKAPRESIFVHLQKSVRKDQGGVSISSMFQPDIVLVRNEVTVPGSDHRGKLHALRFAGVRGVNSLSSINSFCERAIISAELHRLNRELGDDVFPVVPQDFFASHVEMMYSQSFPAVVKVGSAHAGMGKMKVADHHVMDDVRSLVMMTEGKYLTAEPFIEGSYDIRLQKIGSHFRAFKRTSVSGDWKTNTGTSMCEEIALTPVYIRWLTEAGKLFGGLQICTVDAIHDASTGRELIMEVNGTSSGLFPGPCADEDNLHIRDLIVAEAERMCCAEAGVLFRAEIEGGAPSADDRARDEHFARKATARAVRDALAFRIAHLASDLALAPSRACVSEDLVAAARVIQRGDDEGGATDEAAATSTEKQKELELLHAALASMESP